MREPLPFHKGLLYGHITLLAVAVLISLTLYPGEFIEGPVRSIPGLVHSDGYGSPDDLLFDWLFFGQFGLLGGIAARGLGDLRTSILALLGYVATGFVVTALTQAIPDRIVFALIGYLIGVTAMEFVHWSDSSVLYGRLQRFRRNWDGDISRDPGGIAH